jgi:hypothetical protein
MMSNLLRVGDAIISLGSEITIDLYRKPEGERDAVSRVVAACRMRGAGERGRGENSASPYLKFFEEEAAAALRSYLEQMCPDLPAAD